MAPQIENMTIPEFFRATQLLWFSLLLGAVLITGVLYFKVADHEEFFNFENFKNSTFAMFAIGITITTFLAANFILRKRRETFSSIQGLKNKLASFRENFILKASLHEGPTLICIIFMELEQNGYFLLLAAFNWILVFMLRPTPEKFKEWYSLTSEENQELKAAFPTIMV